MLAAFLADALPNAFETAGEAPLRIDLIARSTQSPVVQALSVALADVPNDSVTVRVVVAIEPSRNVLGDSCSEVALRTTPSSQFDDAHEQLSIGDEIAWIGDTMRRDPEKLDAYERFITGDLEACGWTSHAFRQLWSMAIPAKRQGFRAVFDEQPAEKIGPALAALRNGTDKAKTRVN